MTRATPSQYGLSVLLAATVITPIISLVTVELASNDFSVPEIIYLKLVAPVHGTTPSLPEPQVGTVQELTLPDAIDKTIPLVDISTPALFQSYQEARFQNLLTSETITNLETPIPDRLGNRISENQHFRALIFEPRTTNGARVPETFRKSLNATEVLELTATPLTKDLRAPTSRGKTRVESFPRIALGPKPKPVNVTSVTQISTPNKTLIAPPTIQRLVAVKAREFNLFNKTPNAAGNMPFLARGSVQKPNVKLDINQSQELITLTSTPTALFLYKLNLFPTIDEPSTQIQNSLGATSNPLKVPLTIKIPFKEPAPDPFISVMQKIKQLEEKYAKNSAPGEEGMRQNTSGVDQSTLGNVATVQARGAQLEPKYSRIINSQIKANWTLPPGQLNTYHKPVVLRILVNKTGEIQSVQYLHGNNDNDKLHRAFIESAYRAVRKTKILHGLPLNEYDKWRELRLNFRLDG